MPASIAFSAFRSRPTSTTCAPSRARRWAICAPSPRDAPVINAILSTSGLFTDNLLTRFKEPRIGLQITDRLEHALADAQRWTPPEGANAAGVQEDERAVAHPPALAAAVHTPRLGPQALADPRQRVIDGAIFISTKVEK